MRIDLKNLPYAPFFIGYTLYFNDESGTKIEGLHRRFPTAWANRHHYPLFNHYSFTRFELQDDFLCRVSYCLGEHALENSDLAYAIQDIFYRFLPSHYRKLKILPSSEHALFFNYVIETFAKEISKGEVSLKSFEVISSILFQYHIGQWEIDDETWEGFLFLWNMTIETVSLFDKKTMASNKWTSATFNSDKTLNRYPEYRSLVQRIFYKIQEKKGENLVQFLNREVTEKTSNIDFIDKILINYSESCNLMIRGKSNFSKSNVMDIIFQLICEIVTLDETNIYSEVDLEGDLPDDEPAFQSLLETIDDVLPMAFLQAVYSDTMNANRQFFYKVYTTTDAISSQAFERELKQLKQTLKESQRQHKQLQKEIDKLKTQQNREIARQTEGLHTDLREQQQEIRRLQNELWKAQEQIETLRMTSTTTLETQSTMSQSTIEELIEQLNRPSLMIVGGHPNVVLKLRKLLPQCKFFECEKNYPDDFFKDVDTVAIMKIWVNHGMTARARRFFPRATFVEADATNPQRILQQIGEQLLSTSSNLGN